MLISEQQYQKIIDKEKVDAKTLIYSNMLQREKDKLYVYRQERFEITNEHGLLKKYEILGELAKQQ